MLANIAREVDSQLMMTNLLVATRSRIARDYFANSSLKP